MEPQVIEDSIPWFPFGMSMMVSAVFAWGAVETLKRVLLNRWKMTQPPEELQRLGTDSALFRGFESSERGWWLPLMWFLAVALGFGCGAFIGAIGWDWRWGALMGGTGGALSAFLVALLKEQAKRVADALVGKVLDKVGVVESRDGK